LPGPLTPRFRVSIARPALLREPGLLAGVCPAGKRDCVLVMRSSNRNPLGNCVGTRFETSRGPDSAHARFLIALCRSVPDSCVKLTGHDSGQRNW
jgi:hypothetical protein